MTLPTLPLDQLDSWCSAHPDARVALLAPSRPLSAAPFHDLLLTLPEGLTVRRAVGAASISWPNGALALVMTPHERSWRGLSFDRLVHLVPGTYALPGHIDPSFATARWLVHTHGTEEGPGLLCPERRDADGLVGACQPERFDRACPDDPEDESVSLSVVVDRLREIADELDDLLAAVHELRRTADGTHVVSRLIAQAWAHAIQAHQHARRIAAVDPLAVREP